MAADGHSVVDLTDDSDTVTGIAPTPSSSTNYRYPSTNNHLTSSYVPSPSNPAKRSKIDPSALSPLALLNPRAYVGNGTPLSGADIQSFTSRVPEGQDRTAMTLDKRIEALLGVKDRKARAPTPKDGKHDVSNSQDRQPGNGLLSKFVLNGVNSPNVIDLTGMTHLLTC